MRKGLTALFLSIIMALPLLPNAALAAGAPAFSGEAGETIEWEYDFTVTPNTITFSGTGPMTDYEAFDVSHDWNRFSNTVIMIEAGITHVGDRSFGTGHCVGITIASTVESIGSLAFSNCPSLTTVTIDNPNITIAKNAFQDCDAITSFVVGGTEYHTPAAYFEENAIPPEQEEEPVVDYVAPDGTTVIDDYAFQNCTTLETVVLPEGVTTIGSSAFVGCINLKNIELPSTLTTIGEYAFQDCTALETVVLPEGVATIGPSAFSGCTNLKSVTLPSTLTSIGGDAFSGCASLESIQLPENLKTLGDSAFRGCTALVSLTVPKNITSWGRSTFAGCTGLTQLTLSQGLTAIGASAFYNCPGLTSVTIPDSVTSINDYAFRATGLTGVTLPKSVTYLGENPFGIAGLGSDFEWVTDFTITGYAGTEAEIYANKIGFPFVNLTPAPAPGPSDPPDSSAPSDSSDPSNSSASSGSSGTSSSSRHSHLWDDGKITLEPTALTSGLRTYTCEECGATRTESISAGYAAPVIGKTVPITGKASSKDPEEPPTADLRVISSTGTDPDAQGGQAYASTQSVEVDGKAVKFEMYALKDEQGNDTNYVKLRDVALMINGTDAQCNVDWLDGYVTVTTHTPYRPNGSEMKTPFAGDRSYSAANAVTMIDGEGVLMQAFVLVDDNGGGFTYYKLRDLGQALGFNVGWSGEKGVYIETDRLYDAKN